MHSFLRFGLGLAARSELATRALWWLVALPLRIAPRVLMAAGRHLIRNRADRAVLRTHRDLFDRVLVAAFAQRGRGGLEDLRIYARPWGFELEEVAVESFLWHGESDPIVPAAFGRTLAERLPGCTARFVAGGGHQSLAVALADEVVGTLR
jgi:pimeloyl-ACP methyl ester carboxylesterase